MSDIAIRVENLSKRYRIGAKEEQHDTFAGALLHQLRHPLGNLSRLRGLSTFSENGTGSTPEDDILWALKDVSFEVERGEVVGVIGRNGAGKSTLLKILSRITHPTSGRVELHGRVSSLLEVGTGFHPELTGRENVYLNGTILGMRKAEIDRKFDEIVSFSGVEKFLDTPVKRYSSGMRVRLAFSVAAHLEPEILVVDEVLAVGDANFQRKCLGKMGEVASEGRSVVFVSHNMAAVMQLCSRGILLNHGRIQRDEPVEEVVHQYISDYARANQTDLAQRTDRVGGDNFRFTKVYLRNSSGEIVDEIASGEPVEFLVHYTAPSVAPLNNVSIAIRIEDEFGQYAFTLATEFTGDDFQHLPPTGVLVCRVPVIYLVASEYRVFLWCGVNRITSDAVESAMKFYVNESNLLGSGKFPVKRKHGTFVVPHSWQRIESVELDPI